MTPEWVEAIAAITEAVGWPVILAVLLFLMRGTIARAISTGRDFKISIAGTEISIGAAAEQQAEHVADLIDKVSALDNRVLALEGEGGAVSPTALSSDYAGTQLLWVDDKPEGNLQLASALQRLGITVDIATDTEGALKKLRVKKDYAAIVSDMGRPRDEKAGITLAKAVRKELGLNLPFYIFCGGWAAKNLRDESIAAGVTEITSSGTALLSLLRQSLTL